MKLKELKPGISFKFNSGPLKGTYIIVNRFFIKGVLVRKVNDRCRDIAVSGDQTVSVALFR